MTKRAIFLACAASFACGALFSTLFVATLRLASDLGRSTAEWQAEL